MSINIPKEFIRKIFSRGHDAIMVQIPVPLVKKYNLEKGDIVIVKDDPIQRGVIMIPAKVVPK